MLQKIKNLVKNYYLKESEKKWGLYDGNVETDISWVFVFIDQFKTGGHFNSQIIRDNTEAVLIHNLIHEGLHVAICECIDNSDSDFIETVIDDWIMGESIVCDEWEGNLYIKKQPQ